MYKIIIISLFLTSCSALTPDFYRTVDNIATDGVMQIQIDKEAFNEKTNTHVNIEIINRDVKP